MLAKIFDKQESDGYEKKSTSSYKEKIVKPNDSTCYTLDQATSQICFSSWTEEVDQRHSHKVKDRIQHTQTWGWVVV